MLNPGIVPCLEIFVKNFSSCVKNFERLTTNSRFLTLKVFFLKPIRHFWTVRTLPSLFPHLPLPCLASPRLALPCRAVP
jgi:hypothetical protein